MGKTTVVPQGDPSTQHNPSFTMTITSPLKGEQYRRETVIEVICALTVPSGGAMPTSIDLELLDRNKRMLDGGKLVPNKDLGDGKYILTRSLKLPEQAGVYTIQLRAIDSVASADSDEHRPQQQAPRTPFDNDKKESSSVVNSISTRVTTSEPVEVRVK